MAKFADDQKWAMPEKFRASADLTDEAAFALLKKNDAEQLALAQQVQSPFTRSSPRDMYRRKARVTIDTLLSTQIHQPLTDDQIETLAENYAQVGRYDLAAETSKVNSAHYEAIWRAVFQDDSIACPHGNAKVYVSDYIWSIRENEELPLLKCAILGCDWMNVLEKPPHLVAASQNRAQHQGRTKGMTIQQSIAYHQNNVKKSG